ncbi:NAD(P)H-hydrate dehydratase [Lachnospiraceae bacterium HCP1S3_C3]|nr:NAD(P)H-hydrate dehydratase [Lachnospiraceae bacterium]
MRYIVNGSEMKEIDRQTINEIGIPSMVLMERAAYSVYEEMTSYVHKDSRILIVCGSGNNGADGVALGRILMQNGYDVTLYMIGNSEHYTVEMKSQTEIASKIGLNMVNETNIAEYNVIVDAIFGIGLSRKVEGKYENIINGINETDALKVAVDISSGINASSGQVMGTAFKADMTVTFGAVKLGNIIYPGAEYSGKVITKDIGFPGEIIKSVAADRFIAEDRDMLNILPRRKNDSNKGTYGKLLVVAGSKNMCGAAFLCAKAAYRMGTGLVRVFTTEKNRVIMQTLLPEAVLYTYDEETGTDSLENIMAQSDCIVCGPGLGTGEMTEKLVGMVLDSGKKTVLDADALNQINISDKLKEKYHENVVITPHVGEFSRLTGMSIRDIKMNPVEAAIQYAKNYKITCVLKDARTVTALPTGECYININGNSGMAKGGSGDILAGTIGALMCQGMNPDMAAYSGVYIHGKAGDVAADKYGQYGMNATELAESLKKVMKKYENELKGNK